MDNIPQTRPYFPKKAKDFETLYSCVLMPKQRFKMLRDLKKNILEGTTFIMPGFMIANKSK